jgi:hypothetical protein
MKINQAFKVNEILFEKGKRLEYKNISLSAVFKLLLKYNRNIINGMLVYEGKVMFISNINIINREYLSLDFFTCESDIFYFNDLYNKAKFSLLTLEIKNEDLQL